jgi:CBS domain-containing protein
VDIELMLTTETVAQAGPVEPLIVAPETPLRQVFAELRNRASGGALICRDGRLVGIFTERDALGVMQRRGDLDAPIETVMVRDPIALRSDASVAAAILKMSSGGYRRLPIVDPDNRPQGVLEVSGIVHYLVQHFPQTVYNQPPVSHPVMHEREGP